MSYNPDPTDQTYSDYGYTYTNTATVVPNSQPYFTTPNPTVYGQYYYPYNYQQVPFQQQQPVYSQYQPYQYQDVQWVPRPETPGHSYRQNRPRPRGGGQQNTVRRQQGGGNSYNQNYYRDSTTYYNQNSPDQTYYDSSQTGVSNSGGEFVQGRELGEKKPTADQEGQKYPQNGSRVSGNSREGNMKYGNDRGGRQKQYGYTGRGAHSGKTWQNRDRDRTSSPVTSRPESDWNAGDRSRNSRSADSPIDGGAARGRRGRPGKGKEEDESQRGTLLNQLSRGRYECMVCYDNVRVEHAIWNCGNCFHVFHLHCIKKWARSSTVAEKDGTVTGWRCPACQNITEKVPNQYRCYCGKVRDPVYSQYETPHSCGEVCHKKRKGDCPHPCTLLCHPGPCPPCSATVNRFCDCRKTRNLVRCGHDTSYKCEAVCDKLLNCDKHQCEVVCHGGDCRQCDKKVTQECHGGHSTREVVCGSEDTLQTSYSCGVECRRALKCGNHTCEQPCHNGECGPCPLLPDLVTHCQCGQTPLADHPQGQRSSCADPVPACDKICSKPLPCGPKENPHKCERKCHSGECGPCEGETTLRCHCGAKEKVFSCTEVAKFTDANPYKCERRCTKKKLCSRHKCTDTCCTRDIHICEVTCSKKLKCGRHKCKALCHRGNCQPCLIASFDELSCHCGAEIIFPPVACGTRPPECTKTCARLHPCQHTVRHYCHSDPNCPPCTELTEKLCMGGHETRKNIPCHMTDISCGRPCGKMLKCGIHKCIRICHKDDCEEDGAVCKQPCPKKREECPHQCAAPCHPDDPCPKVPCKAQITIKCPCGHRSAKVACNMGGEATSNISEYQKMTVQQLSSGHGLDIAKLTGVMKNGTRSLECNEECALIERNRRVALALEIKNPDLQGKLGSPSYTDFIKDFAKKYPKFVSDVEKSLSDLVQTAKQSKHATRSHAFQPMTRDQRQLVHELAEFYGCETQSYDFEPKKNVVATAKREKCWLPSVSATALIQRELCPKAPPPIPHMSHIQKSGTELRPQGASRDSASARRDKSDSPVIDYFDFSVS